MYWRKAKCTRGGLGRAQCECHRRRYVNSVTDNRNRINTSNAHAGASGATVSASALNSVMVTLHGEPAADLGPNVQNQSTDELVAGAAGFSVWPPFLHDMLRTSGRQDTRPNKVLPTRSSGRAVPVDRGQFVSKLPERQSCSGVGSGTKQDRAVAFRSCGSRRLVDGGGQRRAK
jgi:hypothetical protein